MSRVENIPTAPIGCPAIIEFVHASGSEGGMRLCSSDLNGECHLRSLKASNFATRIMDRPCAIDKDTRTPGDIFVAQLNNFLSTSSELGGQYRISQEVFAPLFTEIVQDVQEKGQLMNFPTIMTKANLALSDDLRKGTNRFAVNNTLLLSELSYISKYVFENPKVKKKYIRSHLEEQ